MEKQEDGLGVSDSAYPIPMCARAPAHTGGITKTLPPWTVKTRQTVTIEALLHWAFAREKVHLARTPGLPFSVPRSPRDSSLGIGWGGCGGGANMGFEAPPDAYTVMHAVDALGGVASVVREFALIGAPPPWTPKPVIRVMRGKNVMDRKTRRPSYCEVTFGGDLPEHVRMRRERYRRWAEAIGKLHGSLSGHLRHHELAPDLPPLEPWK